MDAIAERADVARATVFNHFPSKDRLLVQYHARMNERVIRATDPQDGRDPLGAIRRLFDRFGMWAENDRPIAAALISRMFVSPDLLAQDQQDEADLNAWLVERLKLAQRQHGLRSPLDTQTFAALLVNTLSSTALDWVVTGMQGSLRAPLRKRLSLLLDLAKP
jgi:AcrR family transcriptional regulator